MTHSLEPSAFAPEPKPGSPWRWALLDVEGTEATSTHSETTFSSQSDAESWLGETYGELLTEGIEQVTLYEGDAEVYGPMSLRP